MEYLIAFIINGVTAIGSYVSQLFDELRSRWFFFEFLSTGNVW